MDEPLSCASLGMWSGHSIQVALIKIAAWSEACARMQASAPESKQAAADAVSALWDQVDECMRRGTDEFGDLRTFFTDDFDSDLVARLPAMIRMDKETDTQRFCRWTVRAWQAVPGAARVLASWPAQPEAVGLPQADGGSTTAAVAQPADPTTATTQAIDAPAAASGDEHPHEPTSSAAHQAAGSSRKRARAA